MIGRVLRIGSLLALMLLASGCYVTKMFRQPVTIHETATEIETLRAEVDQLGQKSDALQQVLERQDADQRALRASLQIQIDEMLEQLRSLTIQNQEMMNLLSMRGGGSSAGAASGFGASEPAEAYGSTPSKPSTESPNSITPGSTPESDKVPAEARQLYNTAYRDLTQGNYQLALMEMRDYLDRYPQTDLSDNAQYWIGEIYYAQSQYAQAIEEFLNVVNNFPDADKVPAAYLKTAYSFRGMGDIPTTRRYLRFLMDRYPDSNEAGLARQAMTDLQ